MKSTSIRPHVLFLSTQPEAHVNKSKVTCRAIHCFVITLCMHKPPECDNSDVTST